MWEGQKLLGTIIVRWRRKPYLDQFPPNPTPSFNSLFFFFILMLCADFGIFFGVLDLHSDRRVCGALIETTPKAGNFCDAGLKDLCQRRTKEMDLYVGCVYYDTNEVDLRRKEQQEFEKPCPLK